MKQHFWTWRTCLEIIIDETGVVNPQQSSPSSSVANSLSQWRHLVADTSDCSLESLHSYGTYCVSSCCLHVSFFFLFFFCHFEKRKMKYSLCVFSTPFFFNYLSASDLLTWSTLLNSAGERLPWFPLSFYYSFLVLARKEKREKKTTTYSQIVCSFLPSNLPTSSK